MRALSFHFTFSILQNWGFDKDYSLGDRLSREFWGAAEIGGKVSTQVILVTCLVCLGIRLLLDTRNRYLTNCSSAFILVNGFRAFLRMERCNNPYSLKIFPKHIHQKANSASFSHSRECFVPDLHPELSGCIKGQWQQG